MQVTILGMQLRKDSLISALVELISPTTAIVLKNDNSQRALEGLTIEAEVVYGKLPETLVIEENGSRFRVYVLTSQKTDWFFDYRASRAKLAEMATDKRVLVFSYVVAWAVLAALAGASEVACVDEGAQLNGVAEKMHFVRNDAFDYLNHVRQDGQLYDIIVLDPRVLVKRKKDFKQVYEAYRRLNQLALQVLSKNGILISALCSFHFGPDNLQEILRASGRHVDRHLIFIGCGGQGRDHPIDPAIPETAYLKTFFAKSLVAYKS